MIKYRKLILYQAQIAAVRIADSADKAKSDRATRGKREKDAEKRERVKEAREKGLSFGARVNAIQHSALKSGMYVNSYYC